MMTVPCLEQILYLNSFRQLRVRSKVLPEAFVFVFVLQIKSLK